MPTATSSASVAPPRRAAALAALGSHAPTPREREVRDRGADEHERRAAERLRALAGELEALERRVDRRGTRAARR